MREVDLLPLHCEHIRNRLATLVVDAVEILQPRICQFLDILRHLDARHECTVFLHGNELVDCTKDRVGLRRDQTLAHTKAVHARSLEEE